MEPCLVMPTENSDLRLNIVLDTLTYQAKSMPEITRFNIPGHPDVL
jgi:hypothetical protein